MLKYSHSSIKMIEKQKQDDEWPVTGEVPPNSLEFGEVRGNNVHPDTQAAIDRGFLGLSFERSLPGLDNYAKIVCRTKRTAIILSALGVAAGTFFIVQRLRRSRKQAGAPIEKIR